LDGTEKLVTAGGQDLLEKSALIIEETIVQND